MMNLFKILLFLPVFFNLLMPAKCCFAESYPTVFKEDDFITINFPAGTFLKGILQSRLSTIDNNMGDTVELVVQSDVQYGDYLCFPRDTRVIGKIVKIEKPVVGRNAYIQIVFDKLIFPDYEYLNILGRISTKSNDGIIGGEQTDRVGQRKVPIYTEGIGGCNRIIKYGPRKMGAETIVHPGSEWTIIFDKPLKIVIMEDEYNI